MNAVPFASIFRLLVLLIVLSCCPGGTDSHAGPTVRVVETWPVGDSVTLARNQNFYLRLAYDTDTPVGIWVAAYHKGKRVNVGSSPSPTYSGRGEGLGWFFFMQAGDRVDEIRITAGDGSLDNTPVVAVWRGLVMAGDLAGTTEGQPDWVATMSARAKAAQDEAYQARMQTPMTAADTALASGFMLTVLALGLLGLAAPAWGVWQWQGGWRGAAMVPAAVMVFVVLRIIFDTARDPTSHNLWPFEILMAGGGCAATMGLLRVLRRIFDR